MSYFVNYNKQNQYCIYNPNYYFVFFKKNVYFDKRIVKPAQFNLIVDNSFESIISDKTLIFLSLFFETKKLTKFIYANINLIFALVSNIYITLPLLSLANNFSSTMLKLAIFLPNINTAEIRENEINTILNNIIYN